MKNLSFTKYYIFILMAFFIAVAPVSAESAFNSELTRIENEVWGLNYQNDTDDVRLDRLEKQIFGANNPKLDTNKRINKITQSLGLESLEDEKKSLSDLYIPEKAGQGAEYPIVDSLESTLLGSVYKTEDINIRLERLEKKVFGTKQTGDLSERTEALQRYASASNPSNTQSSYYQSQEPNFSANSSETKLQLSALENMIYGTDFSQDPLELRLTRLEGKIFQRDFSDDDPNMRIQRIQAAATAGKTAKYYDNNKFQKFASTGMQLGTFLLMILAFIL